jgi:sulfate adenylyltransferase subunit 1 (EFTu-like GTPase family)
MEMVRQNPKAQAIQAAAMAHLNEHIAFEYRRQLEEQLGVDLPDPEQQVPKEIEAQLSPMLAKAAEQLLAKNQGEAQQQQAQQQAQDPLIQMQQAELQLKAQELQLKQEKTKADIAAEEVRLQIETMRIESQERIAGAQIGAKAAQDKENLEAKQLTEGAKLGMKAMSDERNRETQIEVVEKNQAKQQAQAQPQQTGETE